MIKTITPKELREKLSQGTVKFQYKKKDGSIREAVGTVNPGLLEEMGRKPAGGTNPAKEAGYSVYFDIEKGAFRCYADSEIIGIVEE